MMLTAKRKRFTKNLKAKTNSVNMQDLNNNNNKKSQNMQRSADDAASAASEQKAFRNGC